MLVAEGDCYRRAIQGAEIEVLKACDHGTKNEEDFVIMFYLRNGKTLQHLPAEPLA